MTIFGDIFFTSVRFSAICGRTTVRTTLKNRYKPNRLILEHFGENRMVVSIFVQKIASAAHTDKQTDILILLIYIELGLTPVAANGYRAGGSGLTPACGLTPAARADARASGLRPSSRRILISGIPHSSGLRPSPGGPLKEANCHFSS